MRYVIVSAAGTAGREPLTTTLCGNITRARASKATGLLDAKGRPIFRAKNPIGFHSLD